MVMYDYKNDNNKLRALADNNEQSELANHIEAQLKSSYNKLLEEPLPDNIQKLLDELNNRERSS